MDKKIENVDISKLKTDNKLYNVEFLLKKDIFKLLCLFTDSYTDMSLSYIPWFDCVKTIKNSKNEDEEICFLSPCAENNYADLSFIQNGKYKNVKACRIKTFDAIPMDGNILTYSKGTINNDNYIVFYSINPNETNKVLIMTTEIYNFFVSHNNNEHLRYFNSNDTDKIKKVFNFNDKQLSFINYYEKLDLSSETEMNILNKRNSCLKTLNLIKISKKNPKFGINYTKTHFGKQYSAFNLINGEIRQFRDAIARNNFFNSIGIKLADNHCIARNCNNMSKIANGENLEIYRVNILEESGWIICNYIADTVKLINFVQNLISNLNKKSKKLANRIKNIFSNTKKNFILISNTIKEKTIELKTKLKKKIIYFRPLHLFEYIVQNQSNNMSYYFNSHPYMKKIF